MRLHAQMMLGADEADEAEAKRRKRRKRGRGGKNVMSTSFRCVSRAERDRLREEYQRRGAG